MAAASARLRWGAFAVFVTVLALATVALPMVEPVASPLWRLLSVAFVGAGVVAMGQQDGRRMGAALITMGALDSIVDVGSSYALAAAEQGWAGALWAQWTVEWVSIGPFVALIALVLLFPTGRPQTRRWGQVLRLLLFAGVVVMVTAAVAPDQIVAGPEDAGIDLGTNPLALPETGPVVFLTGVSAFTGLGIAIASVVGLGLRYRRAVGVEKAQLRWFVWGVTMTLTAFVLMIATAGLAMVTGVDLPATEWIADLMAGGSILFIPVSIWVAMARYRLYDIDRIISRTVAYAVVVLVLGLLYAAVVVAPVALAGQDDAPDLLVAAATLLAAALFQPLVRRVRAAVDRRFARARYDAARTLDRLSTRLRDQVDDGALRRQVVDAVSSTMRPTSVWLWVKDAPPTGTAL